ncbi:MAG TPA: GNAT family N-acetyltransferase [Bryobacteraceae bacterium]|nr:GNAT family N-acetyltransferase [Bryobacteraceae bacterium]
MPIRQATAADLPRMGGCAREFYASSRFLQGFDLDRFCAVWTELLANGTGVIFLLEDGGEVVGALGGVAYPDINSGELIATEFFWFIRDGARGQGLRLYRLFESWARERGCRQIRMVHLADLMPDKLDRVYRHLGFEPIEIHWAKEL